MALELLGIWRGWLFGFFLGLLYFFALLKILHVALQGKVVVKLLPLLFARPLENRVKKTNEATAAIRQFVDAAVPQLNGTFTVYRQFPVNAQADRLGFGPRLLLRTVAGLLVLTRPVLARVFLALDRHIILLLQNLVLLKVNLLDFLNQLLIQNVFPPQNILQSLKDHDASDIHRNSPVNLDHILNFPLDFSWRVQTHAQRVGFEFW